jgi:hypothetical protein
MTRNLATGLILSSLLGMANAVMTVSSPTAVAQDALRVDDRRGCAAKRSSDGVHDQLLNTLANGEKRRSDSITILSDTISCFNCVLIQVTSENWCQHLSTVCPDPWPWHENYEKERTVRIYNCPRVAHACGPWVDSGCCGSSDSSEPPCATGTDAVCANGSEPPQ